MMGMIISSHGCFCKSYQVFGLRRLMSSTFLPGVALRLPQTTNIMHLRRKLEETILKGQRHVGPLSISQAKNAWNCNIEAIINHLRARLFRSNKRRRCLLIIALGFNPGYTSEPTTRGNQWAGLKKHRCMPRNRRNMIRRNNHL